MIYWRFMSSQELLSYLKGNTIYRKDNSLDGVTNAPKNKMFFFDDGIVATSNVTGYTYVYEPYEAYEFMYGIGKYDFLVKFSSNIELGNSVGVYANYIDDNYKFCDTMIVKERYIDSYNCNNMILEEVIELESGLVVDFATLLEDSYFEMKNSEVKDD